MSRKTNQERVIREDTLSFGRRLALLGLAALCLTLLIEGLNRRSVVGLIGFLADQPLMFLLDTLLVLNTLAVALLFHRFYAWGAIVAVLWLTVSITNFIVKYYRSQPFSLADLLLVKDMLSLVTVYFNWFQIIGTVLIALAVIGGIVFLFRHSPRRGKVGYGPCIAVAAALTACSCSIAGLCITQGWIERRFVSLTDAYQDYGFSYVFLDTFLDLGINRPQEYSDDTVTEILDALEPEEGEDDPDDIVEPNIIYVQLESFFDMDRLSGITLSEPATPNWHALLDKWPSGLLKVPVVGGGTSNTEFEVLTGMNMDFFGVGEYPYYTVLRDTSCESVAYVLGNRGYTTTAVHDYMGTFYGRNLVYANLGFQVFESMEYMDALSYGEIGWPEDEAVISSVKDALAASSGRDLVFAVTVGTHGSYPADELLPSAVNGVHVTDPGEYAEPVRLNNYVSVAHRMDRQLSDWIRMLERLEEPTICVFYGDHLPALELSENMLRDGELYQTEYFIWNNFGLEAADADMEAYRLTAYLLNLIGIRDGVMFRYHQDHAPQFSSVGYLTEMEILEYDVLYGDHAAFGGKEPYETTDLRLGIHPIRIASAEYRYGRLLVRGSGFNEFSRILLDGRELPTAYVDERTLVTLLEELPEDAELLEVGQFTKENAEMSRTRPFSAEKIMK